MKRVILESPYGSKTDIEIAESERYGRDAPETESKRLSRVKRNEQYARFCLRDCLLRGEAPIASHLLYTQPGVLDDSVPEERKLRIEAGLVWGALAELTVAYLDLGISEGMKQGIERAEKEGRPIEYRYLPYAQKCTCQNYFTHQALDCHLHTEYPRHFFGDLELPCSC
ncbi:MAG: hypothetical protein WDZ39_00840 [Candidatus Spechtbacterales bacterium]